MAKRRQSAAKVKRGTRQPVQLRVLRRRAEKLVERAPVGGGGAPGKAVRRLVHHLQLHERALDRQQKELRRLHRQLDAAGERFQTLFDLAPVGYLTLDAAGIILEANPTVGRLLGVEASRLPETDFAPFVDPESLAKFLHHRDLLFTTGADQHCELWMRRREGGRFLARLDGSLAPTRAGKGKLCLVALSNLSDREQLRSALRDSEASLGGYFDNVALGAAQIDIDGKFIRVNDRYCVITGYGREELLGGMGPLDLDHADDRDVDRERIARTLKGEPYEVEKRYVTKDGRVVWVHVTATPVRSVAGQVHHTAAVIEDVTHRKKTEEALRREHDFAESLIETAQAIVLVLDLEGRVVRFNPYTTQITGWTLEEVAGRSWFSTFLPRREQKRVGEQFRRALDGLPSHGYVNSVVTKDRQVRQVSWADKVLRDAEGRRVGLLAIGHDVTERLQAEDELRHSRQVLEEFFVQAPVGLLWVSAEGRVLRANDAFLNLAGCSLDGCVGQSLSRFQVTPRAFDRLLGRLASGETLQHQREQLRSCDGSVRHVLIDANAVRQKRRMIRSWWFIRDVTTLMELEQEILSISERERLRLGQELHDDLCQRLTTIEYLCEALQRELIAGRRQEAGRAREISRLMQETITYTRGLAAGLCPMEFQVEGLRDALRHLAARTRKVFGIACHVRCNLAPIGDPQREIHLYRIAQEAVSNAIKHGKARRIDIRLMARGDQMLLGVKDNGCGLRATVRRSPGMGIRLMHYRAGVIGGSLVLRENARGGCEVLCALGGVAPPHVNLRRRS